MTRARRVQNVQNDSPSAPVGAPAVRGAKWRQTAVQRARQAERRDSKAAARKRKQGRAQKGKQAQRKETERARKGKRAGGEPLHTGELKHRRLLREGGGGDSGSHGRT